MKILIITQGVSRIVNPLVESRHKVIGVIEAASRDYGKSKSRDIKNSLIKLYSKWKGGAGSLESFCLDYEIPYKFLDIFPFVSSIV